MKKKKAFTVVELMTVIVIASVAIALIATIIISLGEQFKASQKSLSQTNNTLQYLTDIQMEVRGCDSVRGDEDPTKTGNLYVTTKGVTTVVEAEKYQLDAVILIHHDARVISVHIGGETYDIPY